MNIPVFHRVKYPNRIFIKDIVIYLHRVSPSVKTNQQPFIFSVFIAFKITVIYSVINSQPYVRLGIAMYKSRFTELDVNVHLYYYTLFRTKKQAGYYAP